VQQFDNTLNHNKGSVVAINTVSIGIVKKYRRLLQQNLLPFQ
jgi:hypothetical protein